MNFFEKVIKVRLYKVVLVCLEILAFVSFAIYWWYATDSRVAGLFGGFTAGFVVAFIQLLFSWYEHTEIEAIKRLGIKKILPHRDDEQLYRKVILSARKEISLLGNTANRFLIDFADDSRDDKKALINVLNDGVSVKILLPKPSHLSIEDKRRAKNSAELLKKLSDKYSLFDYRYFDHIPYHNLLLSDNNCLVGPIFPHIASKDCPAIFTDKDSVFVSPYLKHFEDEWERASQ